MTSSVQFSSNFSPLNLYLCEHFSIFIIILKCMVGNILVYIYSSPFSDNLKECIDFTRIFLYMQIKYYYQC